MYIQVCINVLQMAPDYDHLTLMQKVEVFEHALEHTQGDDLAKILWYKSPSSEVKHTLSCFVLGDKLIGNNFKPNFINAREMLRCVLHNLTGVVR